MVRVRLSGVGFAHPDGPSLFSEVDLDLGPGFTALAGPNGAGKSTLLRLVAGELRPSAGTVRREPEGALVAFCRQDPAHRPAEVDAFALAWDGPAQRLRGRFALEPESVGRWPTLSPGERQRWQIAAALHLEPAVLLLDEPTNHLDGEGRAALASALGRFRGVGLVVAHDRAFLDALAGQTVWVESGSVTRFSGTYTEARARMHAEATRLSLEQKVRRRAHARLAEELERRRGDQCAADAARSTRRRMKGPKDSDARSALAKGRAEMGAAAQARAVAVMKARTVRKEAEASAIRVPRSLGRTLFVDFTPSPRPWLFRGELPELRVGARTLLRPTSVALGRDARVHLGGPNGAGKSSLLRALVSGSKLPPERVLLLPQELAPDAGLAALDGLLGLPPETRGHALELVAALGVEPGRVLASRAPSPGETRKLLLARGLARKVWCVLLDEPENHFDVPSIERLSAALAQYPGALILVSHDERLATELTEERWSLEDGELRRRGALDPAGSPLALRTEHRSVDRHAARRRRPTWHRRLPP